MTLTEATSAQRAYLVRLAIAKARGSLTEASRLLGISTRTMTRLAHKSGVEAGRFKRLRILGVPPIGGLPAEGLRRALDEYQRGVIIAALVKAGTVEGAARILGVSRQALWKVMKRTQREAG